MNSKLSLKKEIEETVASISIPANGFSRPQLNKEIEERLLAKGWSKQPKISGERNDLDIEAKIDFIKERVGVEVSFSHHSFIGIDLLKFQTMSYSVLDYIDVGVYVIATRNLLERMKNRGQKWQGSLTFEKVCRYLPHFKSAIQVPIFVLGLDE